MVQQTLRSPVNRILFTWLYDAAGALAKPITAISPEEGFRRWVLLTRSELDPP
ncbi:hypothetical protein ASPTUDRAFT_51345 [Aspergillus tubingensis CBS 134.48]|uniref:Uncharacterized protein n=1 Tax=Aspergillus tubingensis (strain CBS 134.48) TaxID=767770 RepID=A0A1L9NEL4_ASPTC|nr:hypothetical protein ASPTUDRAFT_51345 [Aspergillus tubingensis CBS 134.48]